MVLFYSKYKDLCTILDRMEKEDWAGISAGLAKQVNSLKFVTFSMIRFYSTE